MNEIKEIKTGYLRMSVAQGLNPGPVHKNKATIRRNALNNVIGVLKQILKTAFAFQQRYLGLLALYYFLLQFLVYSHQFPGNVCIIYDHAELSIDVNTNRGAPLSLQSDLRVGGFFGGDRVAVEAGLRFRIGETFSIGAYLDIINLMGRSGYDVSSNMGGYLDYSDPDNPTFENWGSYGDISEAYGVRTLKVSVRFTF